MSEAIKILNRILYWSRRKPSGCLVCYLGLDKNGYSEVWYKDTNYRTHRMIMHLLADFDLDSELRVLHSNSCSSKACIEFNHLRIGTSLDNHLDSLAKHGSNTTGRRKIFCPKGHEYNPKEVSPRGAQICRPCEKLRNEKDKLKRRMKKIQKESKTQNQTITTNTREKL